MKVKVKVEKEIEVTHIRITLPVRYGTEDILNDFPLRNGEVWQAMVEMDTGRILDWPDDPRFQQCHLEMKVVDEGTYILYDYSSDDFEEVAKLQDYVPHGVVPGEWSDYVYLDIDKGVITNWPKKPDLDAFFDSE